MNYLQLVIQGRERIRSKLANELFFLGAMGLEETEHTHIFFFKEDFEEKQAVTTLLKEIDDLHAINYSWTTKKAVNWNNEWEQNYQPVSVGSYCYIYASFHKPDKRFKHCIEINPRMSFGTGHHETTTLMVRAMETISLKEKRVLDLGCGTGILAILAYKERAKKVIAVDIDPNVIDNLQENIQLNNTLPIHYLQGTIADVGDNQFDILLANINRNVLINDAGEIADRIRHNGLLICSGFYMDDLKIIEQKYEKLFFVKQAYSNKNNWGCVIFKKLVR